MPGALWKLALIEMHRKKRHPDLARIVVAIDPAVTAKKESNETGIIVSGICHDRHLWVLEDLSGRHSPNTWGNIAVGAYHRHKADRIVAEVNNGGDLVEKVIRDIDEDVAYSAVHASRGKQTRAEPIAGVYEQGRAHHVGVFPELEDQLCCWVPGEESPDRLDSLVWGGTDLLGTPQTAASPHLDESFDGGAYFYAGPAGIS
jgi:phage terminase large subunit-like protein